jgi:glycosyltransferase involved in cell wall biosynthesis
MPLHPRQAPDALLSIVLPVYNEAGVLRSLADRIERCVRDCGLRAEIVFVNDGSTDGSGDLLDLLAATRPQVRVVHLSRNFGHQAAVQAGLAHAAGDAVVLMDSDLQDAPEAIPGFVQRWRQGADVVYAIRKQRKEAWGKRVLFGLFYRLMHAASGKGLPLDAGNFSLMDRRVVRQILALREYDRYLPGLRAWVGFRQEGMPVERLARYDQRPRVSFRGLVRLAKTAVFSFSTLPLAVFYGIGYAALAVFLGLAGFSLFCKLFTDLAVPGWTSHILSASFFGALNALGICILGEYVIRIYDQVRGRPIYLVQRTVNLGDRGPQQAASQADCAPCWDDDGSDVLACASLWQQTQALLAAADTAAAGRQSSDDTFEPCPEGSESCVAAEEGCASPADGCQTAAKR